MKYLCKTSKQSLKSVSGVLRGQKSLNNTDEARLVDLSDCDEAYTIFGGFKVMLSGARS